MAKAKPKLLILGDPPEKWLAKLSGIRNIVDLQVARNPAEAEALLPTAEVAFDWVLGGLWLQQYWHLAGRLRWVHSSSAGVDKILFSDWTDSPVLLTNSRGIYAPAFAEFVMLCVLYFAKDFPTLQRNQRERYWTPYQPLELRDQTLGLVGFGATGRATARLAKPFQMRVLATKRNPGTGTESDLVDELIPLERWHDLLASSDYVVNALPLTPATRGFFGEREFRAMKTKCCFINVGRGETVQEGALVRALKEGWLSGAGLDVFEREPLPADSELYSLPNVIISPHCAGITTTNREKCAQLLIDNVQRYISGEPLLNVVDKGLGY